MQSSTTDNPVIVNAKAVRSRALYVVLLALAWVQLSYASHQFEHVAGELSDVCTVCTQLDRLDHVVPDSAVVTSVPAMANSSAGFLGRAPFAAAPANYLSRAPPLV